MKMKTRRIYLKIDNFDLKILKDGLTEMLVISSLQTIHQSQKLIKK